MSRQENIREALGNFTPPNVKKGETYTIEDLRPYFSTLVKLANEDREAMNEIDREDGKKVRGSRLVPITEDEVEMVCLNYDYWICLH